MHAAASSPLASPSRAAGLRRRLAALAAALGRTLEAESDRWPLWLPVAVAAGILAWFAAPAPASRGVLALVATAGLGGLGVALRWRRSRPLLALPAAGLAAAAVGVLAAALRLATVDAPVLPRAGTWTVEGRIAELEPRAVGVRLVLDRLRIERLDPATTPIRAQLTVRHGAEALEVGQRIRVLARLAPPRGPVAPGAFDQARQAWFAGIGALGWALGRPTILAPASSPFELALARLRSRLAARFVEPLPEPTGAVAAALVTGIRAGIPAEVWRDFRLSGLSHLLAISGLHMALVAGTMLVAVRWLLAAIPAVAERVPARKPAAVAALLAAGLYLLISGATVPTQRAFLMVAPALLAVLLDRSPFSMRLLAWAALVVLVIRPEALLGASFQLSFAAVLALVAVWERLGRRLATGEDGLLRRLLRYPVGVVATSLVASLATAPLTAYHFQTVATWGVLSNLLAVPLTAFWIMPAGLAALLSVPFGLEEPAVRLMGRGVDLLLAIARTTAALPATSLTLSPWPPAALLLLWAGGLWLALWRRPWRWAGLVVVPPAALLIALERPPELLVTPWLAQIAVAGPDGAHVLTFERDDFVEAALARALGGSAEASIAADTALRCDRAGCLFERAGVRVTLARRVDALLEACREPGLVIARVGPEHCPDGPARLVGPRALEASGGLAVRLGADGAVALEPVTPPGAAWPWVVGTRTAGR